jgi:hypothetical protein
MKKLFTYLLFLSLSVGMFGQRVGIIASSASSGGGGGSTLLNGLLGGWKLDEASGNAADVLGVYTGTSTAITYTASGKLGRCYTFNGTSSNVSFGNVIKPTTAITISAWVKTSATSTNEAILDCAVYGTGWEGYSMVIYTDGAVGFFLGTNTATILDIAANPIYPTLVNNGAWHHIVATWDGGTARIYVDNTTSGSGTSYSTSVVYDGSNGLYLGQQPGGTNKFIGDIDMTYIWNRALGVSGVDSLFTKENIGITYPW